MSMIIRDPIHGDVEFNHLEQRILDCPSLQRLRGLRQLGGAHWVYPGCNHTRFEHAIGTFHVARRILQELGASGVAVEEYAQAVKLAGLVHDVAFVPYGHFLEDVLGMVPQHDQEALIRTLERPEFTQVLGDALQRQLQDLFTGQAPPWTRAVVAGTIDADMLDYLRRDAYYAGLGQAYDQRIFRYLTVEAGRLLVRTERDGLPRPDAVSELMNLLRLRYYLMERVYYHHAKLAAECMLGEALSLALEEGLPVENLAGWGDHELHLRLLEYAGRQLVERLQERRLYKRAYVISSRSSQWSERVEWAERWRQPRVRREAERLLAPGGQALICCLPPTLMKQAAMALTAGTDLASHAPLEVQALEASYAQLWRLYVFAPAEAVSQVQAEASAFFGRPSEYHRGRKVEREMR